MIRGALFLVWLAGAISIINACSSSNSTLEDAGYNLDAAEKLQTESISTKDDGFIHEDGIFDGQEFTPEGDEPIAFQVGEIVEIHPDPQGVFWIEIPPSDETQSYIAIIYCDVWKTNKHYSYFLGLDNYGYSYDP